MGELPTRLLSTTSQITFFTKHFCRRSYYSFLMLETTQPYPRHQAFWIHSLTSIRQGAAVAKIQSSRTVKTGNLRGNPLSLQKESGEFCFARQCILAGQRAQAAARQPQHGGAFSSQELGAAGACWHPLVGTKRSTGHGGNSGSRSSGVGNVGNICKKSGFTRYLFMPVYFHHTEILCFRNTQKSGSERCCTENFTFFTARQTLAGKSFVNMGHIFVLKITFSCRHTHPGRDGKNSKYFST